MNKQKLINELKAEGFSNKIVNAFLKVKREDFIPENFKELAYEDRPLPIGGGVTISQPYTIAFMLDLLELNKLDKTNINKPKILEIGSGSGYVLALINEISKNGEIYGIERIKELVEKSKGVLREMKNIKIIYGDGSKGLNEMKFDRILISASCLEIPEWLYDNLNENGVIVASVKNSIFQIKKQEGGIKIKEFSGFVFVPLVEGLT